MYDPKEALEIKRDKAREYAMRLRTADWIASVAGGQGCVREFCDFLLNSALVASAPVASAPVASAPLDSAPVDSATP